MEILGCLIVGVEQVFNSRMKSPGPADTELCRQVGQQIAIQLYSTEVLAVAACDEREADTMSTDILHIRQ